MAPDPTLHVSADELDALHEQGLSARITSHIATCPPCRQLVALDLRLVAGLSTLPTWDASPTLAARVLGRLTPATDRAVVASMPSDRERAARRRVIIAGLLTGGGVAAGFTWAVLNPAAAQGLAGPAVTEVSQALWLSLQGLVANTIEQPWFGTVRDALASPTRALPYLVGAGVAYALTLVGFRRLLTSPATDAGW